VGQQEIAQASLLGSATFFVHSVEYPVTEGIPNGLFRAAAQEFPVFGFVAESIDACHTGDAEPLSIVKGAAWLRYPLEWFQVDRGWLKCREQILTGKAECIPLIGDGVALLVPGRSQVQLAIQVAVLALFICTRLEVGKTSSSLRCVAATLTVSS
jgi:hypothetical protein